MFDRARADTVQQRADTAEDLKDMVDWFRSMAGDLGPEFSRESLYQLIAQAGIAGEKSVNHPETVKRQQNYEHGSFDRISARANPSGAVLVSMMFYDDEAMSGSRGRSSASHRAGRTPTHIVSRRLVSELTMAAQPYRGVSRRKIRRQAVRGAKAGSISKNVYNIFDAVNETPQAPHSVRAGSVRDTIERAEREDERRRAAEEMEADYGGDRLRRGLAAQEREDMRPRTDERVTCAHCGERVLADNYNGRYCNRCNGRPR